MRGRKPVKISAKKASLLISIIKKESPNEGTETRQRQLSIKVKTLQIKKESPNEGTETSDGDHSVRAPLDIE